MNPAVRSASDTKNVTGMTDRSPTAFIDRRFTPTRLDSQHPIATISTSTGRLMRPATRATALTPIAAEPTACVAGWAT